MITLRLQWQYVLIVLVLAGSMALGSSSSAARRAQGGASAPATPAFRVGYHGLNPAAVAVALPDDIKWSGTPSSPSQTAVLYGDPSKPGLYIEMVKWHAPNHMSRPHFHPNDRFITVLSGTWWKGGAKYDPASTVPIPAGSFVIDKAMGIHYDGAKDQDVVLQVVGMGPETATPVEER